MCETLLTDTKEGDVVIDANYLQYLDKFYGLIFVNVIVFNLVMYKSLDVYLYQAPFYTAIYCRPRTYSLFVFYLCCIFIFTMHANINSLLVFIDSTRLGLFYIIVIYKILK